MPRLSLAKLERHLYSAADILRREGMDAAKTDIARLKGEKEAFEQSNPPDDAEEEDLSGWNYAKDLEREMKELKTEHKEALKELAKLEKAAAKNSSAIGGRVRKGTLSSDSTMFHHSREGGNPEEYDPDLRPPRSDAKQLSLGSTGGKELRDNAAARLTAMRTALQPLFDQLAALEAELAPYEQIRTELAAARARYRELTNAFVDELKQRCIAMNDEEKQALVLELFAQDVHAGLDAAMNEKRHEIVHFIEGLWDNYRVTLDHLHADRVEATSRLTGYLEKLGYT